MGIWLPKQHFCLRLFNACVVLTVVMAAVFKGIMYRILVGKPEGKRPLGRPRRRWEDNLNLDLRKWDVGVWTGLS